MVTLNSTGIEGLVGKDIQDFGVVHINNKKTIALYLSNISKVPGTWKLNHVKPKIKKNIANMTMTIMEKEDTSRTDDPSVFDFNITDVIGFFVIFRACSRGRRSP